MKTTKLAITTMAAFASQHPDYAGEGFDLASRGTMGNKYEPHQGKAECARRIKQIEKGMIRVK